MSPQGPELDPHLTCDHESGYCLWDHVAPDPITPERVTLTEAERAALTWVTPVDNDDTDVYATVERILSDRLRAAGEREARLRALADEWDGYGHGKFNIHLEDTLPCSVCDLLAQLRALLDGDESETP